METTPILILTKDNPEYLYITLKSLAATDTGNNPIIIVDNSSTMDVTKKFLYSMDTIETRFNDWLLEKKDANTQELADKEFGESYLNIPKINIIKGIKRKYLIVRTKKYLNDIYLALYAINLAFTMFPEIENCCLLEDTLLFNKNWLKEAIRIYKDERNISNVGIVSSYSENVVPGNFDEYLRNDTLNGKMILLSHKLYKNLKIQHFFDSELILNDEPYYLILQSLAYKFGLATFTSGISYIQNIEPRHITNKEKVLKFEKSFRLPIAWKSDF